MSEPHLKRPSISLQPDDARNGLAGLLAALQPSRPEPAPAPMPEADPVALRAAEDEALAAMAHAKGLAEGRAEAEAALAPVIAGLNAAASAFEAACKIDPDRLRAPLAVLVRTLCERVLMAELSATPAAMLPLVEAGLASLRPAEPALLRASPALVALLNDHAADALAHVQIEADPQMADMVELSGPDFVICLSLMQRLDDILEAQS